MGTILKQKGDKHDKHWSNADKLDKEGLKLDKLTFGKLNVR